MAFEIVAHRYIAFLTCCLGLFGMQPTPAVTTHASATSTSIIFGKTRVNLRHTPARVILDNGYIRVRFNLHHPQIDVIQADFDGRHRYADDLTTPRTGPQGQSGIVLETTGAHGATHASSQGAGPNLHVSIIKNTPERAVVRIGGIVDDIANPRVTSSWTLSLTAGERAFGLRTVTHVLRTSKARSIRISSYLAPTSAYGLFDRGVVQMMDSPKPYFASDNHLHRFYVLGGGGSVDLTKVTGQKQTVLLNTGRGTGDTRVFYRSGEQQVLAGRYPVSDRWNDTGWQTAHPIKIKRGQTFATSARIAGNDDNFPVGTLDHNIDLRDKDLRAMYTAIYGTTVGSLVSYKVPGESAVTIAHPTRSYAPGYNFYDPDTWMSVSSLVYSGDPYLQNEARKLIETSGKAMLANGQIPHHFIGIKPTYVAISGATQTGPNIFWIEAALQYARNTGDLQWLKSHMGWVEKTLGFLTDRYNPKVQLVNAPGPLWIDVFKRYNYASDTNAFMVKLLRDVAVAEQVTGRPKRATHHRRLADNIAQGMNTHLWADDHYITQLNPDGSTRDFVDYDANLLAVAFGVAPRDRAKKILARIDSGGCTHAEPANGRARPTWVSERPYGPNDTYGGNTGDSAVTMGRIGWADAWARARVGDLTTLNKLIINPIRKQLLQHTWLPERYTCAGTPTHNPDYHGYPEMLTMVLRELRYGVNLGLTTVSIHPHGPRVFRYHVGDVDIGYSSRNFTATVPSHGTRNFIVYGMHPSGVYLIQAVHGKASPHPDRSEAATSQHVTAGEHGILHFTAPVGLHTRVQARLLPAKSHS